MRRLWDWFLWCLYLWCLLLFVAVGLGVAARWLVMAFMLGWRGTP